MKYVAPVASLVELESLNVLLASEEIPTTSCANLLVGDCEYDFDQDGKNDF